MSVASLKSQDLRVILDSSISFASQSSYISIIFGLLYPDFFFYVNFYYSFLSTLLLLSNIFFYNVFSIIEIFNYSLHSPFLSPIELMILTTKLIFLISNFHPINPFIIPLSIYILHSHSLQIRPTPNSLP